MFQVVFQKRIQAHHREFAFTQMELGTQFSREMEVSYVNKKVVIYIFF